MSFLDVYLLHNGQSIDRQHAPSKCLNLTAALNLTALTTESVKLTIRDLLLLTKLANCTKLSVYISRICFRAYIMLCKGDYHSVC